MITKNEAIALVCLAFILGDIFGNWDGDHQTALDCQTTQEAHLVGGTIITCKVDEGIK